MSEASALTSLPPDDITNLVNAIADGKQPQAGQALRVLREHAGVSLKQLAGLFHRKAPTVCGWEQGKQWPRSPELLPGMLHSLGVPADIIAKAFIVELNGDLDSRLYVRGDTTMIEFGHFLKTRGKVLQRITIEAERGSLPHAKLYTEWMQRNEGAVAGRESKPQAKLVSSSQDWTRSALQATAPKAKEPTASTTTSSASDNVDDALKPTPVVSPSESE